MIMVVQRLLLCSSISIDPFFTRRGNLISDTTWWLAKSMESLRLFGSRRDTYALHHTSLTSTTSKDRSISPTMLSRSTLHSMVNTRLPTRYPIVSFKSIWTQRIRSRSTISKNRFCREWKILRLMQLGVLLLRYHLKDISITSKYLDWISWLMGNSSPGSSKSTLIRAYS
jgi:hypothetical protein